MLLNNKILALLPSIVWWYIAITVQHIYTIICIYFPSSYIFIWACGQYYKILNNDKNRMKKGICINKIGIRVCVHAQYNKWDGQV